MRRQRAIDRPDLALERRATTFNEMNEHIVVSGSAQIHASASGKGRPVIFLHAGVADSRMWTSEMEATAHGHRAIAYDRRGFGGTDHAEEAYSQVCDLIAVQESLGGTSAAVLIGCSQGSRIALDVALAHPDRVAGLVLISPAVSGVSPGEIPATAQALITKLETAEERGDLDLANALEARLWLDGPLEAENRVSGAPRALFLDMNGIALRAKVKGVEQQPPSAFDRLGTIAAPTLLVCGDLDFPHLQARSRWLAHNIPRAREIVIGGVAHLPSLEQPAEMASLVSEFLRMLAT